jgi:hypothetical protein
MVKCLVCENEYTEDQARHCPCCDWDLTEYPLSPQGLIDEQSSRIAWAKEKLELLRRQEREKQEYSSRIKQLSEQIKNLNCKIQEADLDKKHILSGGLTRLEYWLKRHRWEEADMETNHIVLSKASRLQDGFLSKISIDFYSSEFLPKIDELWLQYSKGRFGFSIQNFIYQEFKNANDLSGFYEKIAWKFYAEQDWEPKYTIFASPGHLPILRIGGYGKQGNDRDTRVREFFNNGYLPINDIGQHRYSFDSLNSSNIPHDLNLRAEQIQDGKNQIFSFERIKRCEECLGTGATPKTCQLCQWQGFSLITDSVTIEINSNFKNGQRLSYPEKGHDGRYCDSKGNLIIWIKIV